MSTSKLKRPLVSVILISDRPEQMTGSGCCGKVKGDPSFSGADRAFAEARKVREEMGLLYRTVRRLYSNDVEQGRITIATVDPRNQLYLLPKLWRDVLRYRPGWGSGLKVMFQIFSLPALIVNGRVINRGGAMIAPDELSHVIAEEMGACAGDFHCLSSSIGQGSPAETPPST